MPLPHLHLFHPAVLLAPHLPEWLATVEDQPRGDAGWDGCQFHRREYSQQGGFHVPTAADFVNRNQGPVIIIQKAQASLVARFRRMMQRRVSVYPLSPVTAEDIRQACETARTAYEDGEPRISCRELIAYLIVRKLARLGKWGGTSLNKNFLWAEDIPKGGFPKQHGDSRRILQVVDVLYNAGILSRKESERQWKYGLGDKSIVHPILDSRAFEGWPKLQNYFARDNEFVTARLLDYNED